MPNENIFDLIATRRTFFPNLDALRFLAFWGVFTSHIFPERPEFISENAVSDLIFTLFSFPFFGVPFFFTLSSFLITSRILEEYKITGSFRLGFFYIRRTARIWPLYFLALGIIFILIPIIYKLFNWQIPTLPPAEPFIFFYSNFYIITNGNEFIFGLAVFWSLAIEEQFYLLWGIILKYLKNNLPLIITVFFVFSIAFSIWYVRSKGNELSSLEIHSLHILLYLMSGAFLAYISNEKAFIYNKLKSLPASFYYVVYILVPVLYFIPRPSEPEFHVLTKAVNSLLFALIIYDQAFKQKPIFRAGRFRSINYLGKISYGLYVYHALVISFFISLVLPKESVSFIQRLMIFIPVLFITILISHFSYQYVEKRFLKWRENSN